MNEMATRIKYPPCNLNPMTERPYSRHIWVIPEKGNVRRTANDVYRYVVRCGRCGINDPRAPLH